MRMIYIAYMMLLCGCVSNAPFPIAEHQALAKAVEILKSRECLPNEYDHTIIRETNYWTVYIIPRHHENISSQSHTIGNDPVTLMLDNYGKLISILGGCKASAREISTWEKNLRKIWKEEKRGPPLGKGKGVGPKAPMKASET